MTIWALIVILASADNVTVLEFKDEPQCQRAYLKLKNDSANVRRIAPCVETLKR